MPYPTARSESGLAGRRSSAPMKRNECGTEEDLLPYYALFGLPRKLRTLEKTLENIPKAGRRIPGWATFVMPCNSRYCFAVCVPIRVPMPAARTTAVQCSFIPSYPCFPVIFPLILNLELHLSPIRSDFPFYTHSKPLHRSWLHYRYKK